MSRSTFVLLRFGHLSDNSGQATAFEVNPDSTKESFMVTFPYPYSNGHLHIGHAFSLTKAIFRAQFERHQGKNVLFPFAFHCTGMPIQAVSSKPDYLLCFWGLELLEIDLTYSIYE